MNSFDFSLFQKKMHKNIKDVVFDFKEVVFFYGWLKIGFWILLLIEVFSFVVALYFIPKSSVLAITSGLFLFTIFAYFALTFYWNTKKPENFTKIKDSFLNECKKNIVVGDSLTFCLAVSKLSLRVVAELEGIEWLFFGDEKNGSAFKKISFFLISEDVFNFKEMFLLSVVEDHLRQIKEFPVNSDIHASLANMYISLFKLYKNHKREVFSKKISEIMDAKFKKAALWAIEELEILKHFSSDNAWVSSQLAQSYKILGRREDEVKEYENLLRLRPEDHEILFRLGQAYFEMGKNAHGLRIYEKLKNIPIVRAEDLLVLYAKDREFEIMEDLL